TTCGSRSTSTEPASLVLVERCDDRARVDRDAAVCERGAIGARRCRGEVRAELRGLRLADANDAGIRHARLVTPETDDVARQALREWGVGVRDRIEVEAIEDGLHVVARDIDVVRHDSRTRDDDLVDAPQRVTDGERSVFRSIDDLLIDLHGVALGTAR